MPLAFSYLRFSSPEQAKGDSIRRQTEATAEWCQRNGAQLDTALSLRDEGVSAFRGKNRENPDVHGLAMFLAAVKSGRVPSGSFLILENLDRLTRENIVPAVNLFTGLLMAGIQIVQLHPHEHVFTAGADMTMVMLALVELSRGNSESRMKSVRVGSAWANKKQNASNKVLTRRVPGWIRYNEGSLELDEPAAEIIRRIFNLARDGFGVAAIAKQLNAERVPVLGRTEITKRGQRDVEESKREKATIVWNETVVYHILNARTVLGEYQPHKGRGSEREPVGEPVKNYYPPVIDEELFFAVQGIMKGRATVGRGRRGSHTNLFAGLLVDARDGGSLTYKHLVNRNPAIIPIGAKQGKGTAWSSFPAVPFEEAILSRLREIKASDIRGDDDAGVQVESLAGQMAKLDSLVKQWTDKMDNPAIVDVVATKLEELNGKRRALAQRLADAQREAASPLHESWGEFRSLADLLAKDPSDDLRVKVRAAIRRTIEGIYCVFTGCGRIRLAGIRVQFRNSDRHRTYIVSYDPGRSNHHIKRKGSWEVLSGAKEQAFEADLRKPSDAKRVERFLKKLDLSPCQK